MNLKYIFISTVFSLVFMKTNCFDIKEIMRPLRIQTLEDIEKSLTEQKIKDGLRCVYGKTKFHFVAIPFLLSFVALFSSKKINNPNLKEALSIVWMTSLAFGIFKALRFYPIECLTYARFALINACVCSATSYIYKKLLKETYCNCQKKIL